MLGSISGSNTSLFGSLASALAASQTLVQRQAAQRGEDGGADASVSAAGGMAAGVVDASEEGTARGASAVIEREPQALDQGGATSAQSAQARAQLTASDAASGADAASASASESEGSARLSAEMPDGTSAEDDSVAQARAQAIATQESFMKALVMAQIDAGPDEDGLAGRLRRGAENYAETVSQGRSAEAQASDRSRSSIEA